MPRLGRGVSSTEVSTEVSPQKRFRGGVLATVLRPLCRGSNPDQNWISFSHHRK